MKNKTTKEGKKVAVKNCPKCNDELVVKMNDGTTEVFECKNCKFQVRK
jgi:Zn ribbon nucleic-acid-binding protein